MLMFRKTALAAAMLLVCCAAFAAEDGEGEAPVPKPKKARKVRKPRGRAPKARLVAPKPLVTSCPVFSRLALSEDQLAKVKPLDEELSKKFEELKAAAGKDRKKQAEAAASLKTLVDNARKKVVELLTEDQKKKNEEGLKIMAEFRKGMKETRTAYNKALKAARKNKAKRTLALKAFNTKKKELIAARDKALEEKVGKAPEAAAGPVE